MHRKGQLEKGNKHVKNLVLLALNTVDLRKKSVKNYFISFNKSTRSIRIGFTQSMFTERAGWKKLISMLKALFH